jgi:5-methylcytosine-specific restriction endonuclease McrA
MDRQVLLLNASEEAIKVIDWKKAICLLLKGKATKPVNFKDNYEIQSVNTTYPLPSVIMLSNYVHIPIQEHIPTRRNIFKRDKWTCQYCGMKSKNPKTLTIDHVMPKSRGGDSTWTNLVTACPSCNRKKANNKPSECRMPLKNKPSKPYYLDLQLNSISTMLKNQWDYWLDIA